MFELEAIHGGIYKYNFQSESNAQLHPLGPGDAPLLSAGRLSVHGRHTFFQVRWLSKWMRLTVGSLFARKGGRQKLPAHSITPFQALSTALAAAIGTGNIVGVAIALSTGGPGAIFWMWASAFLGMMTSFAEKRSASATAIRMQKSLGRRRNGLYGKRASLQMDGSALCSPLYSRLLRHGQPLAEQFNGAGYEKRLRRIPQSDRSSGGHIDWNYLARRYQTHCRRDGKLVPIMAILYLTAGCAVILINIRRLPQAVGGIISEAFPFVLP